MQAINFSARFVPIPMQKKAENLFPQGLEIAKALRDKTCLGGDMTHWFDYVVKEGSEDIEAICKIKNSIQVPYDMVVVIGTGGSSLGAKAVAKSLTSSFDALCQPPSLEHPGLAFVGDIMSEECYGSLVTGLEKYFPLIINISKSGGTLEPASGFRILYDYMVGRFGSEDVNKRIITVTDAKSGSLRQLTNTFGWTSQVVPDGIGGRYSVLTPVGLLPLALAGFDIKALLSGARDYHDRFAEKISKGQSDAAIEYACYRQVFQAEKLNIELFIALDERLKDFIEWWKQLFGESEGKDGKGLFPAGAIYSRDLHSLGQYVQDGRKQLFETFLTFEHAEKKRGSYESVRITVPKIEALAGDKLDFVVGMPLSAINEQILKASQVAHFDAGVPSLNISAGELDAYHIGALIFFFEVSCAVSALLQGVNPFDQPGVEAYKINMLALLGRPDLHEHGKNLRQKITSMGMT